LARARKVPGQEEGVQAASDRVSISISRPNSADQRKVGHRSETRGVLTQPSRDYRNLHGLSRYSPGFVQGSADAWYWVVGGIERWKF
ncbi:hypothetical protein JG688_00017817, partial [Phytophthora aleatoria]